MYAQKQETKESIVVDCTMTAQTRSTLAQVIRGPLDQRVPPLPSNKRWREPPCARHKGNPTFSSCREAGESQSEVSRSTAEATSRALFAQGVRACGAECCCWRQLKLGSSVWLDGLDLLDRLLEGY